ncbi:uncharacterized protein LOC107042687 [Diachasma alloeum]|uniref:uncharacterized protein LOC107042687 n=1 Tax=Diachasma alloeum TaxID=454923 RepID=UPI0007381C87|nr:uncharacterized protein LOC107042687 [Diachasma alloeum]
MKHRHNSGGQRLLKSTNLHRTIADSEVGDLGNASQFTRDIRNVRKALHRKRPKTSPETKDKTVKKMKRREMTDKAASSTKPPAGPLDWQEVKGRKGKDKANYAEILSRVKKDGNCNQSRENVERIRRTETGDMLITLSKEATDGAPQLRSAIPGLLKEEAVVLSKEPLENLEIKDLDEDTSKEDVLEALQKVDGEENAIALEAVKSLRIAYGGTRTASVTLTASAAKKILGEHGKIKIGWVNCRIRRVERPMKCFKCWHYGHLATKCTSAVDRSRVCVKCAEDGHKAKECTKKELRCALCTENGNLQNYAHVAGSTRCPAYKDALQKLANKRR